MLDISYPIVNKKYNWYTKMAKPQVTQTKVLLDQLYQGKIDLTDYKRKPEEEKKKAFYSRALAAYYLHSKANIGIDKSASCVTDGFNDNGIDAIFYDEPQNTLYLIQSKLINEGVGEPDLGEIMKLKQGVLDTVDEKFDNRFNDKILKNEQSIKDALSDRSTKIIIVVAYTGKGFSEHNKRVINELMESLNDTTEWAFFDDFNLRSIYASLLAATSSKPIDYDISLSNWGLIEEPYKTYYGQISAYELAHIFVIQGKKLFDENIRGFIGLSPINSDILNTIQNEPENFIYFNNGITIICDEINPIPGKTVKKTSGGFHCKSMQVVNGAQTIGSLGTAYDKHSEQLKKCTVFIKLIPLNECPDDFGNRITIASNTQNKIEKRDFATLDPIQHNLRTELALLGITYHYKRTEDPIPFDEKNCSMEEATVALACNNEDIYNSVTAKREIGKLWNDIKTAPYTDLFNESLKGYVMWHSIKIYREVSKYLNLNKPAKAGRDKSTYTYGNYFILNIIFNLIPKEKMMNPKSDLENYLSSEVFKKMLESVVKATYEEGEVNYPTSLIHQLYRNYTKCKDLKQKVLDKLANGGKKLESLTLFS